MTPSALVSPDQIAAYQSQGFVRLAGVFSEHELASLWTSADYLVTTKAAKEDAWKGDWKAQHDGHEAFRLVTVKDIHRTESVWASAVRSPVLVDAVSALSGVPMHCVHSMLIIKPPEHGQAFPPHQDAAYYAMSDTHYLIATLYLDQATHDNGCVAFQPGSHLHGYQTHTRSGKKYLPDVRLEDLIEVPCEAGDVVASSIYTVHGSYPNRSQHQRRLVRLGFRPKE